MTRLGFLNIAENNIISKAIEISAFIKLYKKTFKTYNNREMLKT